MDLALRAEFFAAEVGIAVPGRVKRLLSIREAPVVLPVVPRSTSRRGRMHLQCSHERVSSWPARCPIVSEKAFSRRQ